MAAKELQATSFLSDANLVAYYRLNDNSNDSGPNAYHGTDVGGFSYRTGLFGNCPDFVTADSQYITIPISTKVCDLSNHTFVAWYKQTASPTSTYHTIIEQGNSSDGVTQCLMVVNGNNGAYSGRPSIYYRNAAGTAFAGGVMTGNTAYNDGNWHHMVMRCTSDSVEFIVDTKIISEMTASRPTGTYSVNGVRIGRGVYNSGQGFDTKGYVDDLAIFSRALSNAEILKLYNGGTPVGSLLTMFR